MRRSREVLLTLAWIVAAVAVAGFIAYRQASAAGSVSVLIGVGVESSVGAAVEDDFTVLVEVTGLGHDGQFNYVIATDPLGKELTAVVDRPGYRWRRILMPGLAGGWGRLEGESVVLSLVGLSIAGFAAGTAALSRIAVRLGAPQWVALAVLLNPGLWQSVRISTNDAFALGLALVGMWGWISGRRALGVVLLAAAALTKDPYLLVALGVGAHAWSSGDRRNALLVAGFPTATLAAWTLWVHTTIGDAISSGTDLAWPFQGIVEGSAYWGGVAVWENAMLVLTFVGLLLAWWAPWVAGDRLLRWLAWPWVGLALVGSFYIWAFGNNTARVYAPAIVFGVLSYGVVRNRRTGQPASTSRKNLPV